MHLISLDDLDTKDLGTILSGKVESPPDPGLVVVLDFLPLGREGLTLRAAAQAMGATVLTGRDIFPGFPNDVDLLQAAKAVGAYGGVTVIRHPLKGAARAAAGVSSRNRVLNAGDGAGEDPLFALADLAVLSERIDGLAGKGVAVCGDLLNNRRAHSLATGLFGAGARVLLVPAKGAEPAESLLDQLARRSGYHPVRLRARSMSSLLDMVDSWLLTPDMTHQLSLFSDMVASSEEESRLVRHRVKDVHAIWVASARDRSGEPRRPSDRPLLPWREEDGRICVSPDRPEVDGPDWETRVGPEIRAIKGILALSGSSSSRRPLFPDDAYMASEGIRCEDPGCVACREPSRVTPAFLLARTDPVVLACLYCLSRRKAKYVGSRQEKRFHGVSSAQVTKILPRNAVFFANREEARAAGFVPSKI